MSEANQYSYEEGDEQQPRRSTSRESMRRRSNVASRSRQKRTGPTKFNGIHRRRSKRSSW